MTALVTLWLIYMGVAISPGVNFALIGQTATRHTRREALLVATGVVTASGVWMAAALLGLVALTERFGGLFTTIRVVAGCYLILLGVQKFFSRRAVAETDQTTQEHDKARWQHFAAGFFTGMGNPKAILFFGTLFATALPANASATLRLSGAGLVLASSIVLHAGLASVLSIESIRSGYLRARRIIDPVFGMVFIGFGVKLLTDP